MGEKNLVLPVDYPAQESQEGGVVSCPRCQGLMGRETCMDLADEKGVFIIPVLHCLNCGEIVDPLILAHRQIAPLPFKSRARVAPKTALAGSHNPA